MARPTAATTTAPDPSEVLPATLASRSTSTHPPLLARNLLIAGVASTAVWYGGALAVSYAVDDPAMAKDPANSVGWPVDGARTQRLLWRFRMQHGAVFFLGAIATTLDGIGQAAGLALAAEGVFMPTQEPKRARAALRADRHKLFDWRPTFDAGKNSVGFGLVGVF